VVRVLFFVWDDEKIVKQSYFFSIPSSMDGLTPALTESNVATGG